MRIRGAGGLGDSLYLYPVVKHFTAQGKPVEVSTNWAEVFEGMHNVTAYPFTRGSPVDIECTYIQRRKETATTQYEDTVILAGIDPIPPFEWRGNTDDFPIDTKGKKMLLVHPSYNRKDKHGNEVNRDIAIDNKILENIIESMRGEYFIVSTGGGGRDKEVLYPLKGADLDLKDKTTLKQFLGVCKRADLMLSQCGHFIPLAEVFNKKCFIIFNHNMKTTENFISRTATPDKVMVKGMAAWCYDDDPRMYDKVALYSKQKILPQQAPYLHFKRLIQGKRCVVLGSAPSAALNRGDRIDAMDTVIRVNNYDMEKYSKNIGKRTDIYYTFFGSSIHHEKAQLEKERCKLIVSKIPYCDYTKHYNFGDGERQGVTNFEKYFDNFRWRGMPLYLPNTWDLMDEVAEVNRMMSSGVSAIWNILKCNPAKLYITGFDFFESGIHNIDQVWKNGAGGHKTQAEKEFVKKLYLANRDKVVLDDRLKEVMKVE